MTYTTLPAVAALVMSSIVGSITAPVRAEADERTARVIAGTSIVGEADPALWRAVLDVLPVRPRRIVILDVGALSTMAREKVRRLDAFVVEGDATVFVLRQARTLRQAEVGDAFDRLVLASVIFHEMSHARGLDERAALDAEQGLWRRFIAAGRVEQALGMTYVQRLDDERRKHMRPAISVDSARPAHVTATRSHERR